MTLVSIYGRSTDIDGTACDIGGGNAGVTEQLYTHFVAAEEIEVVGAAAADTLAGTGAQQITIVGLDADGNAKTVVVDMAGASTDTVAGGTWSAVNHSFISQAGANSVNAALVLVVGVTSSATYSVIPLGLSKAKDAVYTVPVGRRLCLTHVRLGQDGLTQATGSIYIKVNNPATGVSSYLWEESTGLIGSKTFLFQTPLSFEPGAQISIGVAGFGAGNLTGSVAAYGHHDAVVTRYYGS